MLKSAPNSLENKIELLRKELLLHVTTNGLHGEQTILVSQRLDTYIAKYQMKKTK